MTTRLMHASMAMAVATAAAALVGSMPARTLIQASACRTAPDTASAVLYSVTQLLASNDLDTNNVTLVTDPPTCQAIVDSYNAASDSLLRISSGYVVQTDSTYALYLMPVAGTPYKTQVLVLFDSAYRILVRMEGAG